MKKLVYIWTKPSLIVKILIGILLGAAIGLLCKDISAINMLGVLFVSALKAIAPVLVLVLVISAVANANTGIGKKFGTVIILYLLNTFLAAVCAVVFSRLFPVTITLSAASSEKAPEGVQEVLTKVITNCVANPVSALSEGNYLGILFWAIVFGLAFKFTCSETTRVFLNDLAAAVTKAVRWIINLAPFGIFGLVYSAVSTNGLEIFTDYGKLLAVVVGCMLAMALIVIPLIVFVCLRENPYPLVLRCLKESGLTAFFTRSSAANIPVNMELCEKLGLDRNLYSVSIPLGATINMNGAAITITVLTLAAANTLGIHMDLPTCIILSLLATISACGASGVAGGSLLLVPLACSLVGIPTDVAMQVVAVGFIVGVIQDSCETAINSSGDVIFAATAEFMHRKKEAKKQQSA